MSTSPTATEVLLDAFGRIPELVHDVIDGIDPVLLVRQPVAGGRPGNSIGWIVWHLARMEDAQIAELSGEPEVHAAGWQQRLGTQYPAEAQGYGQSAEEVAAFTVASPTALTDYYDAVHARTVEVLESLTPQSLSRIVDDSWDPPVTAMVRLVSVVDDAAQHAGQAAYLKGLLSP